jgi:hypothetical protein
MRLNTTQLWYPRRFSALFFIFQSAAYSDSLFEEMAEEGVLDEALPLVFPLVESEATPKKPNSNNASTINIEGGDGKSAIKKRKVTKEAVHSFGGVFFCCCC